MRLGRLVFTPLSDLHTLAFTLLRIGVFQLSNLFKSEHWNLFVPMRVGSPFFPSLQPDILVRCIGELGCYWHGCVSLLLSSSARRLTFITGYRFTFFRPSSPLLAGDIKYSIECTSFRRNKLHIGMTLFSPRDNSPLPWCHC